MIPTLKPRIQMQGHRLASAKVERKRGWTGMRDRNRIRQRDNGLCQACLDKNIVTIGTEVDHIIPLHKGGPDTDDNKQLLCDPCHVAKTRQERGAG